MEKENNIFSFRKKRFDPLTENTFIRAFKKAVEVLSEKKEKLAIVIQGENKKIEIINSRGESKYQMIFLKHLPINKAELERMNTKLRFFENNNSTEEGIMNIQKDIEGIRA